MVVGGQTTFDPIRPDDVHLVQLSENSVDIIKSGNVTDDVFDVQSVDVTADCSYALYGNRSPFTDTFGRLSLVDLTGTDIELVHSIDTDEDISQVKYLPHLDLFLVSSFESESLATYRIEEGQIVRLGFMNRMGLVANFSELPDGELSHIIVASVHASQGSRIGTLSIGQDGQFTTPTWTALGEGAENIPSVMSGSTWLQ